MKKIILSENKMNQLIAEVSDQLMSRFSFPGGFISGDEILKISEHKQVGNFILFRVYQDWNSHVAKFVHPWFNFDQPEVKDVLRRFMNVASKHIRIPQSDFRKLLETAVFNTLRLILNPAEAFQKFFFQNTDRIPVAVYRKHAPYFADYDFVIQSIMKYLDKNEMQALDKELFFEKFARVIEIFETKQGKSIRKYQSYLFHRLTGKNLMDVLGQQEAAQQPPAPKPQEKTVTSRFSRQPGVSSGKTYSARQYNSREDLPKKEVKPAVPPTPKVEETPHTIVPPVIPQPEPKLEVPPVTAPEPKLEVPPTPEPKVETPPVPEKEKTVAESFSQPETKHIEILPEPETPVFEPKSEPELPTPEPEPQPEMEIQAPEQQETPAPEEKSTPVFHTPEPPEENAGAEDRPMTLSEKLAAQSGKKPSLYETLGSNKGESIVEQSLAKLEREAEVQESTPENKTEPVPEEKKSPLETPTNTPVPEAFTEPVQPEQEVTLPEPPVQEEKTAEPEPEEEPTTTLSFGMGGFESTAEQSNKPIDLFSPSSDEEEAVGNFGGATKEPTLMDKFKEGNSGALHEQLGGTQSIELSQIPVHKQFQFVQKLFGGSSVKFKVVLDKINETSSLDEANALVQKYVFSTPGVNPETKIAGEFREIVKRRFS